MRGPWLVLALCAAACCASARALEVQLVDHPSTESRNAFYVSNKAPLKPNPLIKLPIGAIKPQGWLRTQLERMADGFVGRLPQISQFLREDDNAWLSPDGQGHSPWEEVPYWLKGYGDLGYVLGDEAIIATARKWLDGAIASQRSDGYFGPRDNLKRIDGTPDLWSNMIMLNALQSYHEYSGDERVLKLMRAYFKWEQQVPEEDFLRPFWQHQRAADNLASVYWLYNRTGEAWLLELAEKIHRHTAPWTDEVANWHGVNITQAFRGPGNYYVQSHDPAHLAAVERNYQQVMDLYGRVPGGMFGADEVCRRGYTGPRQAAETCSMVEFMLSFEMLLGITGDLTWADRCEDVALNSLPASMTADLKALRYLTAPNHPQSDAASKSPGIMNGGPMYLMNPHRHRCCQHNVAHGWPYFAEHLWMATPDNGLAAVFYVENEVTAQVGDGTKVTIAMQTDYPFSDTVTLKVKTPQTVAFPLYLRVPGWCDEPTVRVADQQMSPESAGGQFVEIRRRWRDGDTVTLTLPMRIEVKHWPQTQDCVSIERGPLTYSLKIEEDYRRAGGTDKFPAWEIWPASDWNYGLALDANDPATDIEVVESNGPLPAQPFYFADAPVQLRAKARKIPQWTLDHNGLVHELQPSPAKVDTPLETVTLIPMGAARLRVSAFPTVTTVDDAEPWTQPKQPQPASASHCCINDTVAALTDGVLPSSSHDTSLARFTWWPRTGTTEWVQVELGQTRTVSRVGVYWYDDTGAGECRPPEQWRLLWRDGDKWRPVRDAREFGVALDQFNEVTFMPVRTDALRIEARLQEGFSAGILEWQIGSVESSMRGQSEYPISPVPFTAVQFKDDFWRPRLETNRKVTIPYAFKLCEDTGRIDNIAKAAGVKQGAFEGIRFNDSDVFKVMEGAAYTLLLEKDPELDAYLDKLIELIAGAQEDDGYLYTPRTLMGDDVPEACGKTRWSYLQHSHELYNVGHMYEAVVAHHEATGKRSFLDVAIKNADLIDRTFGPDKIRDVPGHQEIEIGLAKLYRLTGDERYLELAKFFLDERGRPHDNGQQYGEYAQDHQPVLEQTHPVGHAVRAAYMYCGMADVAALTGDQGYIDAIDRIWENMVGRRMYLTGGIGARHGGEAFGEDYELPNAEAYAETCAAIANAFWNHRMFCLHGDARYIDVLERVIYNGFISGVSLSGDKFFYVNPLACHVEHNRQPWFGCACCPTNIVRFLPSLPGYVYATRADALYVNLFVEGEAKIDVAGQQVALKQKTHYPWDGKVRIEVSPRASADLEIRVRIPGWAQGRPVPSDLYRYADDAPAKVTLTVNGDAVGLDLVDGYVPIRRTWQAGDVIELDMQMPIRRVLSHEKLTFNADRVALERGPIVYCIEAVDHEGYVRNVYLPDEADLRPDFEGELLGGVMVLRGAGRALPLGQRDADPQPTQLTAVPYYAWNHRGPGEMAVWLARTPAATFPLRTINNLATEAKASASHCWNGDSLAAVNDSLDPDGAGDVSMPRMSWYDHKGSAEWLQYDFPRPTLVSRAIVCWYDDGPDGECRLPKSWRILALDGDDWRPVADNFPTVPADGRSVIEFEPLRTTALRLEVQLAEGYSAGVLEWALQE